MSFLSAFVLIAILVFIHEFGHFIVAKACGVHCKVLSIGYGKRLIGFEWGGTDYRLSMLPFGGYVLMAGADPFGTAEADDDIPDELSFMKKPVWKRLLIVAAGPAFNLILPIVCFTALLMGGEKQPGPSIGEVEWGTPAHNAGLIAGDNILQINGVETPSWSIVYKQLQRLEAGKYGMLIEREGQKKKLRFRIREAKNGEPEDFGIQYLRKDTEIGVDDPRSPAGLGGLQTQDVILSVNGTSVQDYPALLRELKKAQNILTLEVERKEEKRTLEIKANPAWKPTGSTEFSGLDLRWGIYPATVFIDEVAETITVDESGFLSMVGGNEEQSPAYLKGLKPGDRFSKIDGMVIRSWGDVLEKISDSMEGDGEAAKTRLVKLELVRAGELKTIEMLPKMIRDTNITGEYRYRPILGTTRAGGYAPGPTVRQKHSFDVAISRATKETGMIIGFIVKQIGKLITGEASVSKNVGGPVEIVRQASEAAEDGLYSWIQLMSMLSISLGVVNLIPFPVLDGGQLLFYSLEAIRGKPLPLRFRERAQQIGVLFLFLLMLFVLVFDINRWLGG